MYLIIILFVLCHQSLLLQFLLVLSNKSEAVLWKYSIKKLFLKVSHSLQENACIGISFLITKERLQDKFFPVNFATFLRTLFLQNTSGQLSLTNATEYRRILKEKRMMARHDWNEGRLNIFNREKQRIWHQQFWNISYHIGRSIFESWRRRFTRNGSVSA